MLEMRPASQADVAALGRPLPMTSKTFAFTHGKEVVAISGYYFHEGKAVLFSAIKHDAARSGSRWYARDVLKFSRKVLAEAQKAGIPIAASADPEYPGSDRLLKHLGMEHLYKDIYLWHGSR